ncbi:butyrophilin-like protein 8 [Neoarius graeffei]|uniref:butyrophilin-like protein 8 n=1 Tax=Neoarius graeffei TaxID=443677 RepID=UPI00298D2523|nr:butyrophilin-like protein 8 [Neoarius graeffei]
MTRGFSVHGPSDPFTVQMGGSVMLPCFVDTPLPMEGLEVESKRNDYETLVHLWQDGESQPESQNQRYQERAHFFTEEIIHGNFSLFLTSLTREDVGVYKCVVYTNMDSSEILIEIKEIETILISDTTHVISAYVGEDITLNCSVDSHIPLENIEEVSWKKMDEDILVLLYQEGEVLIDSSHERYKDRVEFAEKRNKGNFSLRLKDVRTEDKGRYMCLAFSGELSDNTTVEVGKVFSSIKVYLAAISACHVGFGNATVACQRLVADGSRM